MGYQVKCLACQELSVTVDSMFGQAAIEELLRLWPQIEVFVAAGPRYLTIGVQGLGEGQSQLWQFMRAHSGHPSTVRRIANRRRSVRALDLDD